jgi:hypothetical protein
MGRYRERGSTDYCTVPTECLGTRKFENMRLILKGGPERLERGGPC